MYVIYIFCALFVNIEKNIHLKTKTGSIASRRKKNKQTGVRSGGFSV